MQRQTNRAARASVRLAAIAVATGALLAAPVARADDVTIENFTTTSKDGATFVIKHAEFANTNLNKDEIEKLLTPDTPKDDELALVRKLKADKISIPMIDMTPKTGGLVHLRDFVATDVDSGKVGKLSISGIDGSSAKNGAKIAFKSGVLVIEDADLAEVLKATGGSAEGSQGRLGHLTWESVDIIAPDEKSGPGKTMHMAFGSFELSTDYAGDVIKQGSTTLKGFILEPSPGSEFANQLAALGYSRLELGAAIGAHYDASGKALTLDDFVIDGVKMGSIGLKANFGDIDASLFSGDKGARMQALFGGSIASLEIKLINSGLFEKALAFYAKQQGATPDALRQQLSAAATQMVPLLLGGAPESLKVAAEAQKFIDSPKNLTVSVKAKGEPLKAADFIGASDPSAIVSKLDISASANQ